VDEQLRSRRSDAIANRQRILDAARAAFAASGAETSMAEVARRAGLGSATLYRNFPTRQALLETLLLDEVDELCAAVPTRTGTPGERLAGWLREFFGYVTTQRPLALDLLVVEDTDITGLERRTRQRLIDAGRPLLHAAQEAGEIRGDLGLEQVLDLVMAVAKIVGPARHRQPIFEAALDGLRPPVAVST
jgi:AcrR family transcriptional regulator